MPLIDTDHWWKKHAVTTRARIVEIVKQGKPNGKGFVTQRLAVELTDPASGQTVRAESDIFSFGGHVLGEELPVRWSAERQQFREFTQANCSDGEWLQWVNGTGPAAAPAEPRRVETHTVNLVNASGVDSQTALAQLEALHAQGAISDEQLAEIRKTLGG